jgi:hypothetical protein
MVFLRIIELVKHLPLAAVVMMILQAGCRPGPPARANPTMPPKGSVRIIPKKVAETGNKVQWVWTVLGDRNWTAVTMEKGAATLSKSYPLNDLNRAGGTHVWELWVTASSSSANDRNTPISVEIRLRGSNAAGITASETVDGASMKLPGAFRPTLTSNQTLRLPLETELANVAGRTIRLAIKE